MRPQKQHITTPLALAIAGLFSPAGFAEEVEQDTETMVVRGTAEEALKQQPEEVLEAVGAYLKTTDEFFYDTGDAVPEE